jgi:anthranilate synthase component 1
MYSISRERFIELSSRGNLIPVFREIFADLETPVSAFIKMGDTPYSYLLESVQGGEKWGRYTFIGMNPSIVFRYTQGEVSITDGGVEKTVKPQGDPLDELKKVMSRYTPVPVPGLPRFYGGAVGFITYDSVRYFEKMPDVAVDDLGTPDAVFAVTDTILIFDNIANTIKVVSNAYVGNGDPGAAYDRALGKIDSIITKLRGPLPYFEDVKGNPQVKFESSMDIKVYERNVERCKEYITEGDIFQVVLAHRLKAKVTVPAFQVYRALRAVNPSPYMYYLNFGNIKIVGASPESLVRVEEGIVETRPIAGTRPRGKDADEDKRLIADLLSDEKERAEHLMLVDLGRNDIGRVAVGGTVKVDEFMSTEKYSHVIHIVSNVKGKLSPDRDAYDALRAVFPAGTLSGAPKIRAMEIIEEMEGTRRGVYGGAVGYFSFSGNMDMAIAIRTLQIMDGQAYLGVGGGIVADSVPSNEHQETMNKGRALIQAVRIAENGLEPLAAGEG